MIMTGNVRSLRNKVDELSALCRYDFAYRESSMICLTETWLQERDPDSSVDIDGFTLLRCDRKLNSKTRGGGVCVYVNEKWCKNVSIVETHCDKNIEILVFSLRSYYLPREINKIITAVIYIQ
jgi:ribosome assembly protein 1